MGTVPKLQVLQGPDQGNIFELTSDTALIGRRSKSIDLSDHTVSRRHAELREHRGTWEITDLGSSNGTYVDGERVDGTSPLKHNVQIKVGGTVMVFKYRRRVAGYDRPTPSPEIVDMGASDGAVDSAILSAIQAGDESMILAAPETANAVHAWNLMYELAEAIGAISSVNDLLNHVTEIVIRHVPVDRVFMLMREEPDGELKPVAVRYRAKGKRRKKQRISVSRSMIRHVIDQRKGVLCANADKRFGTDEMTASLEQLALQSVLCVPIVGHESVQGVMHLDCAMSRHTYTHEQLRLATAIGSVVGLAIENHQLAQARMRSARLAATGETVAYLSHHIRNILQGLRSGADVVASGLKRDNLENVRTGWGIVENNLDRVYHLATNMLTFSKDREPRIEMIQINSIVDEVLTLAKRPASEQGVRLAAELGDVPAVPADGDGLHQALFNLVLNAIAACPANTGEVMVATEIEAATDRLVVRVRDNGSGMSPEQQRFAFLPFHSSKGQGGTGLGLAAAKKILDELGGTIRIDSRPQRGTTFTIELAAKRTSTIDLGATHSPTR
jgi:two-component system NtrC family sensor kinase